MLEYRDKFPAGITAEQQAALIWKIESDFRAAHLSARACKNEYVTFAIRFYTRNRNSLADILEQHRSHTLSALRYAAASAVPVSRMATSL